MAFTPERENLYRGLPGGVALRDGEADGETGGAGDALARDTTLVGHFAVFNEWTEIDSWYEGQFLERIVPGAFKNTIKQHIDQMRVQFDHGCDDFVGGAPLGPIDVLREDDIGAYYEVPLIDTDYNRDRVLPLLQGRLMTGEKRGSLLGASFRFRVVKDLWDMEPKLSDYNPKGLPERTISQVTLFEFGPVVFPAYPAATAMTASQGMRSLSDHYLERRRSMRAAAPSAAVAPEGTPVTPTNDPVAARHSDVPLTNRHARLKAYALAHRS